MAESQVWNNLGYIEKSWIAAKASLNGSALSSEGESVALKDCGIDTMKIATLGDYLADRRMKEGKDINFDLRDDEKLSRRYVIPVTLPNGQEIEVIVNQEGQDEACMYRDEEGNEKEFQLTPRMKEAIESMMPSNLKEVIGEEAYKQGFIPETLDDYAEKVQQDELVPKNAKHAVQMAGITADELEKEKTEIEEAEKEIPTEARDKISKICSEQNLDITTLKEVMEVEPEVISDNLEETGIRENNGRVYCLRFRDAANLQGRVVMVQGEKAVDERRYDDYMNDYMNEHKDQKVVEEVECEHDKIAYTDLHGNTVVCEMMKEPRDLGCSEKELIQAEMEKLDKNAEYILNSDMPLENKTQEMIKINQKRLDIFKSYGITVPTVENEIEADMEISEEVGEEAALEQEDEDKEERGWGHERLSPEEEAMQRRGF